MERIETKEDLDAFVKLSSSEERVFRRALLSYYGALICFTNEEDANEYIPQTPVMTSFLEKIDGKFFVGVVYNGRAALIPMKQEVLRALCVKEKPF